MTEVADNTLVDGRYRILQPDRLRRDGRRLLRRGHAPRARGRAEGAAPALRPGPGVRGALPARGASAAGLQHPNVVGVFDRGEHDGTYYIAMEHLRGRTLKDIVDAARRRSPRSASIDLGVQILQAAGFAHQRGVIHRDFKPHNVIVDDDGQRQGHRLRHRARGRLGDDRDRLDHGHRAVPLARAGAGPRGHRRVRPLLDRRDPLRDAHRPAAVRGRQRRRRSRSSTCPSRRRRRRSCGRTSSPRSRRW